MTYVYRDDGTRAVSVVIGVMLLISILFVAAAQYQLMIVPQEEETTEINHHDQVSSQMGELHSNILQASSNGAQSAQTVNMGVEYERDLIFGIIPEVHQQNPQGTIATEGFDQPIKVENAEGLGSASNYWPGNGPPCGEDGPNSTDSDNPDHCFPSVSFHYSGDYNQYQDNPEIVYENTLLYDHHDVDDTEGYSTDDEYVLHADQDLVHGRTLNLVALTGNVQQTRVSSSTVQTVPVSAPAQSITVEQNTTDGDPVTVEVPSRLPASVWEDKVLANEMSTNDPDDGGGYVRNVTNCGDNCVEIEMVEDEVYNLKLSRVHLTTDEERSPVPVEKAAYVAWKGNDRLTIQENSTTEINAQVRDRYNNPVSGIDTKAYANDSVGECIGSFRSGTSNTCNGRYQPGEQTSGEDGTVTYYYEAPDVDSNRAISIQMLLDDDENALSSTASPDGGEFFDDSRDGQTASAMTASGNEPLPAMGPTIDLANPLPKATMGHLSTDGTLRVIDLELDETSTTVGHKVTARVTLDNTGEEAKTATISPSSSGGLESDPGQQTLTLEPGERTERAFDLRFLDSGNHTLNISTSDKSGMSTNVHVFPASTEVVSGTIQNRHKNERINKTPSLFKDGDGLRNEYQEDRNIPPATSTGNGYEDSSAGNLRQFQHIDDLDGPQTVIENESGGPINVGLTTNHVPDNEVYTLFISYQIVGSTPSAVNLSVADSTGEVIDEDSNYLLPNSNNDTVRRAYQLTNEEADVVRQSADLHTVINSSKNAELRINRTHLVSSENSLNLTDAKTTLVGNAATSTDQAVTGETYTVSAEVENTGDAVGNPTVFLHETDTATDEREIIRTKEPIVNPGNTETVEFTLRQYNPGEYEYGVSLDNEGGPDTGPSTIEVGHR